MADPDRTVVADPAWVWRLFPLAGAGLGWLLKLAAGWVASLPAAPLQGLFRVVDRLPDPWATLGAVVVGAVAGLVFAYHARHESLTVAVAADQAVLTRRGSPVAVPRERTSAVFRDGKELVLLDQAGAELSREGTDLDGDELARAFTAHGWPWCADGDPHRSEFRRWVSDLPELSPAAHALFRARERALGKGDHTDAAELRAELARLGLVVRDEQTRQFWRQSPRAS